MKMKARVDVMAARTKVWPTICWLDRTIIAYSVWASYCFGFLV